MFVCCFKGGEPDGHATPIVLLAIVLLRAPSS
jgi:hypothetical protein